LFARRPPVHPLILSSYNMMCKNTTSQYLKMQCGSPVSVIDISAVFEQLDQLESLKLRAPSMTRLSFPVDSITASFTEETDSISSLSTGAHQDDDSAGEGDREREANQRSIFSKYWQLTGEKPLKPQSRMASLRRQRAIADGMYKSRAHCFSHPSQHEGTNSDMADCSMRTTCSQEQHERPRRRSIFGHKALPPSLRSLPTMVNEEEAIAPIFHKKTRSASALQERPASCLRCHAASRRRSSSVSFDEKIDVVIFQKPQEQFSEDGWEQLFRA